MRFYFTVLASLTLSLSLGQAKQYDVIVNDFFKNKQFNGIVLISNNGTTEFIKSCGIADRQLDIPINNQSKFKICSITKTFVAVLIMQLYENGKIELTDKIGKYLIDYKGEAKDKVTIHQLLTYSSGIPNCEHNRGLEVYQKITSVDDFINLYCSDSLEFKPGSRFNYDNGAYIILGRIIEKITGKSFANNLYDKILQPLGMKNTGIMEDRRIVKGLIPSYTFDESLNIFKNDPAYFIENYYSSAAMFSTIEDLLKFDNGIFSNRLIKLETKNKMLTSYPELYGVAYGFWVTDLAFGNRKTRGADRQGAIMGSNVTWLHLIPENKSILIFSNTNATNINELRTKLVTEMLTK
jgi:teichoic acid D-alanine hydrolase